MKPPELFDESDPRRCLPLVNGVELPGGDRAMLWGPPGDDVPGDLEYGEAYRCEEVAAAAAAAENGEVVALVGDIILVEL